MSILRFLYFGVFAYLLVGDMSANSITNIDEFNLHATDANGYKHHSSHEIQRILGCAVWFTFKWYYYSNYVSFFLIFFVFSFFFLSFLVFYYYAFLFSGAGPIIHRRAGCHLDNSWGTARHYYQFECAPIWHCHPTQLHQFSDLVVYQSSQCCHLSEGEPE